MILVYLGVLVGLWLVKLSEVHVVREPPIVAHHHTLVASQEKIRSILLSLIKSELSALNLAHHG